MKRVIALAAFLLTSCDLAPTYHRPGLPAPATMPTGGAYPKPMMPTVQAPDIAWRDFFTDPALRETIAAGLANNRDLRIALANIEQARAQYRVQRADQLPTIGINAGATYQRSSTGASTVSTGGTGAGTGGASGGTGTGTGVIATGDRRYHYYSVDAGFSSFEIDLFGRVRNLTKAALEQYLATEEGAKSTRITLISEIASAWLTMAADEDQLRISRDTLESFRQSYDLTTAQFKAGVSSELEVRQAQTSYEQARYDIAALTTQIARDQNALNLLVGTTVGVEMLPTGLGDRNVTLADLPAGISSSVLLQRPDVLQAEHQLIAQNANIGAARAAFFPQISLTAVAGTLSPSLSGLFGGGNGTWSVAPAATLPIFDFGRNSANLKYAKASRDVAIATYERTVQTGFREVADALAERGTIGEQLAARTDRTTAASTAYRLSDARYRAGVDQFLTTLDAQRTLYTAQQDLTQTRLGAASNLVELYRALGGGLR